MGRNAQRRREAKEAKRERRHALKPPAQKAKANRAPTRYLSLPAYISMHWPMDSSDVMSALVQGKVNVNGEIWAYPEVPKHLIEHDECGRLRIMIEGYADPRPCEPVGGHVLRRR